MAKRFSIEAVFTAIDKITAPVRRMTKGIGRFTRTSERNIRRLNRTVDSMGRAFRRMALVGVASLTAIAFVGADVIKVGADFEHTLVAAATRFPTQIRKGTEAFRELELAARKTGATTEFTATESAQALNSMAKAGFTAKDAIAALPRIIDFATVAEIGLADAASIATKALGQVGLRTDDAAQQSINFARVIDVMALAANRGNTTVADMFEGFKQGAPVMRAAGAQVEEIAAMFSKLADAGIEGTSAGTGIKRIGLAIRAPGTAAARIFRKLIRKDFNLNDDGSMRTVTEVLKDLGAAVKALPEGDQLGVLERLFGKIAIGSSVNVLDAIDNIGDLTTELKGATGNTKRWADIMRDTTRGSIKNMMSAIEALALDIFELNKGPIRDSIDGVTMWIRENKKLIASKIGEWLQSIIKNLDSIIAWGKSAIVIAINLGAMVIALKTMAVVLAIVNTLMFLNPVVLFAMGIAALVVGLVLFVSLFHDIETFFREMPTWIRDSLGPLGLLVDLYLKLADAMNATSTNIAKIIDPGGQEARVKRERIAAMGGAGRLQLNAGGAGAFGDEAPVARGSVNETKTTNEVQLKLPPGVTTDGSANPGPGVTVEQTGDF